MRDDVERKHALYGVGVYQSLILIKLIFPNSLLSFVFGFLHLLIKNSIVGLFLFSSVGTAFFRLICSSTFTILTFGCGKLDCFSIHSP